jgi:hypothetical protein
MIQARLEEEGTLLTFTLDDPIEYHCAKQNGKTGKNSLTDICMLQRFQNIVSFRQACMKNNPR